MTTTLQFNNVPILRMDMLAVTRTADFLVIHQIQALIAHRDVKRDADLVILNSDLSSV